VINRKDFSQDVEAQEYDRIESCTESWPMQENHRVRENPVHV